jgi:hypothetical protein
VSPGEKATVAFALFSAISYAGFSFILGYWPQEVIPTAYGGSSEPKHQKIEDEDDDSDGIGGGEHGGEHA